MHAVGHDILQHRRVVERVGDTGREVRGRTHAAGASGVAVQVGVLRHKGRPGPGAELELEGLGDGPADEIVQRQGVAGERHGEGGVGGKREGDHVQREAAPDGRCVLADGPDTDVVRSRIEEVPEGDFRPAGIIGRNGERAASGPGGRAAAAGLHDDLKVFLHGLRSARCIGDGGRAFHCDGHVCGRLDGGRGFTESKADGIEVGLLDGRQGGVGDEESRTGLAPLLFVGEGHPLQVVILGGESGHHVGSAVRAGHDPGASNLLAEGFLDTFFYP